LAPDNVATIALVPDGFPEIEAVVSVQVADVALNPAGDVSVTVTGFARFTTPRVAPNDPATESAVAEAIPAGAEVRLVWAEKVAEMLVVSPATFALAN
jgi:hypothetical protein